jgi:hypothetical protein
MPAVTEHRQTAPPHRERPPYRLVEEILARSVSADWGAAKAEWSLADVYFADSPGACLCGHAPIVEHCVLVNRRNGNVVTVGNVCVTRFMGILAADRIFQGLRRVMKDREAKLNKDAVAYAHHKGWINDWELDFYLNTCRKRKLSPRQRAKRSLINEHVVARVKIVGVEG